MKKIIIAVAITAFVSIGLTLGAISLVTDTIPKAQVKKVISSYYKNMKTGNLDKLIELYPEEIAKQSKEGFSKSPELKKSSSEMLKLMSSKTTYKIETIKIDGKKAVVTINEKGIDQEELQKNMATIMKSKPFNISPDTPDAQLKMTKYQLEIVKEALKSTTKIKETPSTIALQKNGKKWVLNPEGV